MTPTASPLHKTDRQVLMEKQQRYYDGYPTPQLRSRSQRIDDNLPLPLPRIIVDKGASFLFGKDCQSQILDAPSDGPQEWLEEAWRRNRRGIFLQKLAINGGTFGHAFVRLLDTAPYPRAIVLDPRLVEVECDPDDCETVISYAITLPDQDQDYDGDGTAEATEKKRTLIERVSSDDLYETFDDSFDEADQSWTIKDQIYLNSGDQGEAGSWKTLSERIWPHPFSPVFGCQNLPKPNSYWGESDLPQDVLTLIDGINRVASHYNKIVRLFSNPKVWTRGMGAQKMDLAPDAIIHLPSETAELRVLETPADLPSIMGLLEKLLSLNAYAVRIPLIAMGQPDGAGSLSGVALQIRYQPLLEKTESKRLTYGELLTELDRCMLLMGGFGDSLLTQIVWPELLPKDPIQEREAMILEDQLGITSKHTFAEQLGLDYDQEQEQRAEEAQTAVDAMPMPVMPGQSPDGTIPDHPATAAGQQLLGSAFGNLMQSKLATKPNGKAAAAASLPPPPPSQRKR